MGVLIYCVIFSILAFLYMLLRNEWVFNVRIKMIHEDCTKYQKLPSYDYMLVHFWVWDVNKFVKEG